MDDDSEPAAMIAIAKVLSGLPDDAARRRVIAWVMDKHGILARADPAAAPRPGPGNKEEHSSPNPRFELFAELFDAVRPENEQQKALAAAYWKCRVENGAQFTSQETNRILADLGHRIANITEALSASMREKPALILQLRKSGSSRQARKTYKLSEAGSRWIEQRLKEGPE